MDSRSIFTALFFLSFGLFSSRLKMKVLPLFLNVIDDRVVLRCFLLFGVYFSEWFRDLLEGLSDVDSISGTDLKEFHASRFTELLYILFFDFSIFLFAIYFIS